MKFLINRNGHNLGGLNIEIDEESLINNNHDIDLVIEIKLKEFFESVVNDFQHNYKTFEFFNLRDKFIEIDLWNKCSIDVMDYNDSFEVWICGDDGMLEFEIKSLNNIKFLEVK